VAWKFADVIFADFLSSAKETEKTSAFPKYLLQLNNTKQTKQLPIPALVLSKQLAFTFLILFQTTLLAKENDLADVSL